MLATDLNYGDTFRNKQTGEEVRVRERNDEKVFISEQGDVYTFIDENLWEEIY